MKFRWETEFKETEIGKIPRDWEVRPAENICVKVTDGTHDTPKPQEKGFYLITSKHIRDGKINFSNAYFISERDYHEINKRSKVDVWDVLFSMIGTVGMSAIVHPEYPPFAIKNVGLFKTGGNKTLAYWLHYYFQSEPTQKFIQETLIGTTQNFLPLYTLRKFLIPYPSPEEQTRIATVLSWFDDLIENKRKQNEILEKTAMAIFKSWFIDFEPFQDEEFVYNEELDMEIPKGWEVKPIGEVAEFYRGISYKGEEKFDEEVDGGYVFITLNNIVEGGGFKPEYAWIKSKRLKNHHFLRELDLIIANTHFGVGGLEKERLLASPAIVFFPQSYKHEKGVYSHHITKITLKDEKLKFYMYLFLKFTKKDSARFATGTGVLGLDIENFKKNKMILIPPRPILQRFHSLVEPLFQKIILNQKQILTLKKIRDTLLPYLVFGRLRVEEI